MTFEHTICPVCRQPFTASDDVVVCPDCGTPHHRACWALSDGCVHSDKHADGFVWHADAAENRAPSVCPLCGGECAPDALFCPECGTPIGEPPRSEPENDTAGHASFTRCPRCGEECDDDALVCPVCGKQLGVATDSRFDYNDDFFLRGVNADPDADLDGFTVREAAMYVQFRAKDYVRKFGRIKDGKKTGWNWAAFFFSPFWFFYRKIPKIGLLFVGAMLVLSLFMAVPLQKAEQNVADTLQKYVTIDENTTAEQIMSALTALAPDQQQVVHAAVLQYVRAFLLFSGVVFSPNIAAAIVADLVYKKKLAKELQSMREFAKNDQTFRMLALRRGGVSLLGLIGSYVLMSFIFNIILYY